MYLAQEHNTMNPEPLDSESDALPLGYIAKLLSIILQCIPVFA